MEVITNGLVDKFQFFTPSSVLISGASGQGKTKLVTSVIQHASDLFEVNPDGIIVCYKIWQPLYDEMRTYRPDIIFIRDLPKKTLLIKFLQSKKHTLLILDDMMNEACNSSFMSDVFCQYGHHFNCSIIVLTQNLTLTGKYKSDIVKNTQTYILMNNPCEAFQIRCLATKLNDFRALMGAYQLATLWPRGYLLVDLNPKTDQVLRYRTHIFPGERCVIYVGSNQRNVLELRNVSA